MRILIVEDEEKMAKSLKEGFEEEGYATDYVMDGEAGKRRVLMHHMDYDVIVLDLMLPKKNGFEVCKEIRESGITTPVLILTARDTIDDKVLALDSGADDYLVKPFSFDELLARVRALLRRPKEAVPTKLRIADLILDPARREVFRGGKKIELTLKEFELLSYLMRNPGKVLNREDIFSRLWDFADNSLSNTIDVHIKNLRKKIDSDHDEKLIETIRGIGYRIKE